MWNINNEIHLTNHLKHCDKDTSFPSNNIYKHQKNCFSRKKHPIFRKTACGISKKMGFRLLVLGFFDIFVKCQFYYSHILLHSDTNNRKLGEDIMNYTYKYPRPAVTADCVVMTLETNARVLLIERGNEPYKGHWAIPGGFLNMDETTEQCAIRELEEETGLRIDKVHQIGAYSKVDRDPRGRTISVAYLAIIEEALEARGQDDAAKAKWFYIDDLPPVAFDHDEIMADAIALYNSLKNDKD